MGNTDNRPFGWLNAKPENHSPENHSRWATELVYQIKKRNSNYEKFTGYQIITKDKGVYYYVLASVTVYKTPYEEIVKNNNGTLYIITCGSDNNDENIYIGELPSELNEKDLTKRNDLTERNEKTINYWQFSKNNSMDALKIGNKEIKLLRVSKNDFYDIIKSEKDIYKAAEACQKNGEV